MTEKNMWNLSPEEALKACQTSEQGLTTEQAEKIRLEAGENMLKEGKKKNACQGIFPNQTWIKLLPNTVFSIKNRWDSVKTDPTGNFCASSSIICFQYPLTSGHGAHDGRLQFGI